MKRKITLTFFIALLLICAGVIFSKHDTVKYKSVLNRNGVSEEAIILKTSSKDTLIDGLNQLAKHPELSFRLHFISKKNPNFSYFYSQNENLKLPITSGRNFSQMDFQGVTPFVIAGNNVKNIYKPQEQAYYQLNGSYLPVIGTLEADANSKINNHIFVSISPNFPTTAYKEKIKDYKIILDGVYQNKRALTRTVKTAFSSKKTVSSANKINNVKQKLIEKNSVLFLLLLLVTVIIAILNFNLLVPMKYLINHSELEGDLRKDFQVGIVFQYILYNLISFGASYAFIRRFIVIINLGQFSAFFAINIAISIGLAGYIFFAKKRRTVKQ